MKIYYKENGRFVKATGDGIFKQSENVNEIQFKLPGVPNNSVVFATFLLPYPQETEQYGQYSVQSLKLENKVDTEDGGYLWGNTIPGGYLVNNGRAYISARIHLPDGTITYTENEQTGADRTITIGTTTYVITYVHDLLVLTSGSTEYSANSATSIIIDKKIYLIEGTVTQLQLVGGLKVKTTEQVQFIIENSGNYEATAVLPELGEQILYELANQHSDIIEIQAELDLKQDKTDSNLETTSKTVVGAINELKSDTDSLDTQINSTDPEHPGINSRLATAEQDIADINTEQGIQNTYIETNTGNISTLQTKVSNLESIVGSGEDYIGTYPASETSTLDPNNPSDLATLKSQLTSFVIDKRGSVQGGDVVIYIQTVAHGTDKNYKFIYSGAENDWTFYEIPASEKAENDTYGIVKGSLGAGKTTEVDIVGGEFEEIWVTDNDSTQRRLAEYLNTDDGRIADLETDVAQAKQDITDNTQDINTLDTAVGKILDGTTTVPKATQATKDGLNRTITDTYLTQTDGVTKTQLVDYALPRIFNDVSFVGANNKFVDTAPSGTSPLYTATSQTIGDTTLFYAEKTIAGAEFQLSRKNSYSTSLYITASADCRVAFRVTTQIYKNGAWVLLNAELTDVIGLEQDTLRRVNFASTLNSIDTDVIDVATGDTIKQTFEVVTSSSDSVTFSIYSNETYPSTFNLNVTSQTIVVTDGLIGQVPYYECDGTLSSDILTFTLPSTAVLQENLAIALKLKYSQTIPSGTYIKLRILRDNVDREISIKTPYNYQYVGGIPQGVTIDNLKQAYISYSYNGASAGIFLTGILKTFAGRLCYLVNFDDLSGKQNTLTFDDTPTENSTNPVKSGGVYSALAGKQDKLSQVQLDAVNSGIDSTKVGQIATNTSNISTINGKIPSQASTENQLADKAFVNSSIATNTANFIGTFADIPTLNAYSGTITNNDYAFVINSVIKDNGNDFADTTALNAYDKTLLTNFDYAWVINGTKFDLYRFDIVNQTWGLRVANVNKADVTLNTAYNRYKAVVSGSTVTWTFEYTLNNSSFTAVQWTAINSGINPTLVAQITTNAGNISDLQTYKQDVLTAGSNITIENNTISSTDTNTWRAVKVDGTQKLDGSTSGNALDLIGGTNVTLSENNGAITINADVPTTAGQVGAVAEKPDGTHYLISNNKISTTYLPDYLLGQLLYGGTVTGAGVATLSTNAQSKLGTSNSSITLTNDTTAITGYQANEGIYYVVSSAGTFASLSLAVGDWLISTGSAWQKIDNTDAVTSVNGQTGAVNLTASNVSALPSSTKYGASLSVSGTSVQLKDQDGNNLGSAITTQDTTYSLATTSANGLMPQLDSASVSTQTQATKFLREDGTWQAPSYTPTTGLETTSNKVTSLNSQSTDDEYPSAKCVYDIVGDVETLLTNLNSGNGV